MKEIDFLPTWYKNARRQQITYRAQYIALGGLFVLMLVSNFVTGRSISRAQGYLNSLAVKESVAKSVCAQYAKITNQIAALKKNEDILKKIDSRINVSDVLAELSFLVGRKIVLTKVELTAEKFGDSSADGSAKYAPRPAVFGSSGKEELLLGDIKFKVVLEGIATDAKEAGEFVCRLEDSVYFCNVYLVFTRNRPIKVGAASVGQMQGSGRISRQEEGSIQLNEFEIVCYLANFTEK